MLRPWRWVRRGVLLLAVLVYAGFALAYGSWDWWWAPQTRHVLGRADTEQGTVSPSTARAQSPGPLHVVSRLPLGQEVLAVRSRYVPTVIYLHELDGRYAVYALAGGP